MVCVTERALSQSSTAVHVRDSTNWFSQNESTESTASVMVTSLSASSRPWPLPGHFRCAVVEGIQRHEVKFRRGDVFQSDDDFGFSDVSARICDEVGADVGGGSALKIWMSLQRTSPEVGASEKVYSTKSEQLSEYQEGTSPKSPKSSHGVSGGYASDDVFVRRDDNFPEFQRTQVGLCLERAPPGCVRWCCRIRPSCFRSGEGELVLTRSIHPGFEKLTSTKPASQLSTAVRTAAGSKSWHSTVNSSAGISSTKAGAVVSTMVMNWLAWLTLPQSSAATNLR